MQNSEFRIQTALGARGDERRHGLGVLLRMVLCLHAAFCILNYGEAASQTLLDRVLIRVDGYAITLTDARAAIALGIVERSAATDDAAVLASAAQQLADRQLLLSEVARFPPPEPNAAAIDAEVATLRARAGDRLPQVMVENGLDDSRLRDLARDTVRIQAYINQRFGAVPQVTDDDALEYYRAHPQEFTRNNQAIPFDEVAATARERAANDRRRATVAQLVRDLRSRAEVVEPTH
jgi:hypothetical protein